MTFLSFESCENQRLPRTVSVRSAALTRSRVTMREAPVDTASVTSVPGSSRVEVLNCSVPRQPGWRDHYSKAVSVGTGCASWCYLQAATPNVVSLPRLPGASRRLWTQHCWTSSARRSIALLRDRCNLTIDVMMINALLPMTLLTVVALAPRLLISSDDDDNVSHCTVLHDNVLLQPLGGLTIDTVSADYLFGDLWPNWSEHEQLLSQLDQRSWHVWRRRQWAKTNNPYWPSRRDEELLHWVVRQPWLRVGEFMSFFCLLLLFVSKSLISDTSLRKRGRAAFRKFIALLEVNCCKPALVRV